MNYNRLQHIIQSLQKNGHNFESVYDIGANQGDWSRQWKTVLPKSSFVMFEASPNRVKPSWVSNDIWINVALSKPGIDEVSFFCSPASSGGTGDSYYKENTPHYDNMVPTKITASTLDSMIAKENLPPPKLIKIDTQGSEVDILKGSRVAFQTADVCVSEVPVTEYNLGAPSFGEYIQAFGEYGMVPVGIDQDHYYKGVMIQVDLVFVKHDIIHKIR